MTNTPHKVVKNKATLSNAHSLKKPKEAQRFSAMKCPGLDPRTKEKGYQGKKNKQ